MNETGQFAGSRSNDTAKFEGAPAYELGQADRYSSFKTDDFVASFLDANGNPEQLPYPRVSGTKAWNATEGTLWIKSIEKNKYVGVDLNKRVSWPAGSEGNSVYPVASNNKGPILAVINDPNVNAVVYGILLPLEIKVVDRDDPKKKWGDEKNLAIGRPIYSGESCGDMVSFKLGGTDSWTSMNWTWTATGPNNETINGPAGIGKTEWKIADGDQDTSVDWIKWKPGKWKIKVQIDSITTEFEQEIAIRTEQYFCFGTIPVESEPTAGVLQRIIDQWACPEILGTLLRVPGGGVNNPAGDHFIPKDEANRVYVIHRLLNVTRNFDPIPELKPDNRLDEACGLDPYKHYRFFAGCQFKFETFRPNENGQNGTFQIHQA